MPHARFSFIDLLVLIAVTLATGTAFIAALTTVRESPPRIRCGSNLSQLGKALLLYNNDFDHPPRTIYTPGQPLTYFTNPAATDPFKPGGPAANDVTAAVFLLIRTQDITGNVFTCPSAGNVDPAAVALNVNTRSNFVSRAALSYAWVNPYPSPRALAAGYDYRAVAGPEANAAQAVAADLGPDPAVAAAVTTKSPAAQMKAANSPNHDQDGQNVLFGDSHVEFVQNPFVSIDRDNIYAAGANFRATSGSALTPATTLTATSFNVTTSAANPDDPADATDAVLRPSVLDGPSAPAVSRALVSFSPFAWFMWGVLALFAIMGVVVSVRRLRAARAERPA